MCGGDPFRGQLCQRIATSLSAGGDREALPQPSNVQLRVRFPPASMAPEGVAGRNGPPPVAGAEKPVEGMKIATAQTRARRMQAAFDDGLELCIADTTESESSYSYERSF